MNSAKLAAEIAKPVHSTYKYVSMRQWGTFLKI